MLKLNGECGASVWVGCRDCLLSVRRVMASVVRVYG